MTMDTKRKSQRAAVCDAPRTKAVIQSDQPIVARALLSGWRECRLEKQEDGGDCGTEWREEEDHNVSDMSPGNRELWDSFLNTSDCYTTLHFSCTTVVKATDNEGDHEVEEESKVEGKANAYGREEEDSDWSEEDVSEMSPENKALWESFLNSSDAFNPLHFSCPTGVKLKTPEIQPKRTSTVSTAEPQAEPGTEKRTKKVRFSEQVTVHTLEARGAESQAARDGSCWTEMARDRARFRRRVNGAEETLGSCLAAPHRADVRANLLGRSDCSSRATHRKRVISFILAALCLCSALLFTSIR